jgi:hypothetical protein
LFNFAKTFSLFGASVDTLVEKLAVVVKTPHHVEMESMTTKTTWLAPGVAARSLNKLEQA